MKSKKEVMRTSESWQCQGSVVYIPNGGFDVRNCPDPESLARRIVACVNACAGIDTEWLENNGAYAVPVPSLRTLLNQRDELLAAIEGYLPYMPKSTAKNGGAGGYSEMLKASDMLKDAFAKFEVKS